MRWTRFLVLIALASIPCVAWAQRDPLGPEFRVNTYTTSEQARPAIASDSNGNFVVVWRSVTQDGSSYGVFGQRLASSGAPLGPEFRVNTFTTGGQFAPAVVSDPSGNFVVVWTSSTQDGSSYGVFGQRFASSGAPLGPEFRVNTYTTGNQLTPGGGVASDAFGNFVVVWQSYSQDGELGGIFGQRYASSGAPLGAEFRVNTYTAGDQFLPSVATDASGNFVVIWDSAGQDGSGYGVFGQRYASSGAPLGPEFRVNAYTTGGQVVWAHPIGSDASGNFVVTWQSDAQDGSNYGVFGQRYASSGAPLGPEFRVNSYTTNYQGLPAVAADSAGNFVVAWQSLSQDGSSTGVFGQRYVSSGAPFGPEFLVNTYTTNVQGIPAVAADASGNFVVAWQSYSQDGSSYGVFSQRYGPSAPVTITVNTVNDELNSDGDCSLREAIRAANTDTAVDGCLAGQGHDVIIVPAGTYNLTLAGPFEDLGATGDLDLNTALAIRGAGSRTTRINAGGLDRVFDVRPAGSAALSGLTIGGGSIDDSGGAIRNQGSLTVTRSTVRDSLAIGDGGGIHNSGTLLLTLSSVFRNQAFNSGGGISNNGTLRAVNSTLSGNRVTDEFGGDRGGGLRSTGGSVEMLNVTINVNEAGTGGGIVNDGGAVSVRNVIVANSPGRANCEGRITSAGHNLDSGATCGFTGPGDLSNTNPLLGPLADNGGPTNTHTLLPDSPAIDAGTNNGCPNSDQRGVPRPQDGDGDGTAVCDMGSVEAIE